MEIKADTLVPKRTRTRKPPAPVPEPQPRTFNQPKGAFIDVIRRGNRRRGYIVVVPEPDNQLAVGYSLCETRDRFDGSLGLDIAFKRAERWRGKKSVFVVGNGYHAKGDNHRILQYALETVVVPHTLVDRILADVNTYAEKHMVNDDEVHIKHMFVVPEWVRALKHNDAIHTGNGTVQSP